MWLEVKINGKQALCNSSTDLFEHDDFIPSEVSEMHIGMVKGKQVLLITPGIISIPD